MTDGEKNSIFVSHRTLRRIVGVLGVSLPVVVAVWGFALCGCWTLQDSISDYYTLRTRDAFVGILFVVGWFLFAYKGYEDDDHDDLAGNLACLFALCVALFPNNGARWESAVHFVAAAAFFLVLGYFSLVLFTKGAASPTSQKRTRNKVYVACGVTILASISLIGLSYWLVSPATRSATKVVFWLETLALWAFGFSWFVKGETLWRDP